MLTPKARGSLSEALFAALPVLQPGEALTALPPAADDTADEQVVLWTLYELHYRGFEDVHPGLEWHPDLPRARHGLELELEKRGPAVADVLRHHTVGLTGFERATP